MSERGQRKRRSSDSSNFGNAKLFGFFCNSTQKNKYFILSVAKGFANCFVYKKDDEYSENDDILVSGNTGDVIREREKNIKKSQ